MPKKLLILYGLRDKCFLSNIYWESVGRITRMEICLKHILSINFRVSEEETISHGDSHKLFNGKWPVLAEVGARWDSRDILSQIITPPANAISNSVPVLCQKQMTFIIDSNKLGSLEDITGDDNGKFMRPSTSNKNLIVSPDGSIHFPGEGVTGDEYVLRRRNYTHAGTSSFKRMIYYAFKGDSMLPHVILQYFFVGKHVQKLNYQSHGNCKNNSPFMPRRKSVLNSIKVLAQELPPAKVVSTLLSQVGGTTGIESISQTPRNRKQVYNVKQTSIPNPPRFKAGSVRVSNFDAIAQMSIQGSFVKSFELCEGGHPRVVCATEQQISDLRDNCTGGDASVLQIDPTFCLGQFYLTCTTFRHKKFINASNNLPALLPGPCMLHATREITDYEHFGRHISRLLGDKTVAFVGTDGEKALISGLHRTESFSNSLWLLCMNHAKDNCLRKMTELGITKELQHKIVRDIYGYEDSGIRHQGLVDSESEEDFDEKCHAILPVWDIHESANTNKDPKFSEWFLKHKSKECKSNMLLPLRRMAGLGDVNTKQFTTNDVEAENARVKREMNWEKNHGRWQSAIWKERV